MSADMGRSNPDRSDETSFYVDHREPIQAATEAADRFTKNVLQYEWAAYLKVQSTLVASGQWIVGDVGRPWGRVAPNSWNAGRERGIDFHFEHHPTRRRFRRGRFQFDLHLENCTTGDADFTAGSPYAILRDSVLERIDEGADEPADEPAWVEASVGSSDDQKTLWTASYRFAPGDSNQYYETLQTAMTDHREIAARVSDALDSFLAEDV